MSTVTPLSSAGKAQVRRPGSAAPLRDRERVQIRAARLRVTTDKKLGKQTPAWVVELARRPL